MATMVTMNHLSRSHGEADANKMEISEMQQFAAVTSRSETNKSRRFQESG